MAGTQVAEFNNLRVTAQGFPYSLTSNAGHIPSLSQDCEDVFVGVLQAGPTVSDVAALANVVGSATDYTTVRNGADCEFYYSGQSNQSGATIPVFTYVSATGIVNRATVVLP